jgi:hypothetical protein
VYCGVEPGTTYDHVPPKNLFPEPRPSNLVTVPCCESCRRTQSLDDEYFKDMVVMRNDVAEHPVGQRILKSVHRALKRPQGHGFAAGLARSVRGVDIVTPAGLYIGRGATYNVNLKRLDAVVRRTLLGLYFHETGVRLPDTHDAVVFGAAGLPLNDAVRVEVPRTVSTAISGRVRVIGDRVVTYAFQGFRDVPHASVWVFLFYERVAFIGFTASRTDLQRAQE